MTKRRAPPRTGVPSIMAHAERLLSRATKRLKKPLASNILDGVLSDISELCKLQEEIAGLAVTLRGEEETLFMQFESELRASCADRRWDIDGQWPKFYIAKAVAVEIEEGTRKVIVAGEVVTPPTVDNVILTLMPTVETLIPSQFSAQQFLNGLADAYDDARAGVTSTQIAIMDVYRHFIIRAQTPRLWRDARTSHFSPITIDQFRARLARMLAERATTMTDGRELRLLPPLNPKDALFVFQPAESRFAFVGRVEFVRPPES